MQASLVKAEFHYQTRVQMVLDCSQIAVPPLADLIVSYCINQYHLFEEFLFLSRDDQEAKTIEQLHEEFGRLKEKRNALIVRYAQEMKSCIPWEPDQHFQLRLAMTLSHASINIDKCQRMHCFWRRGGCNCQRVLYCDSLDDGILTNSF